MDAVQIALVSGAITSLVKLIQAYVHVSGVYSLLSYLGLAALGVGLWTVSQPTLPTREWIFGLFAAWVVIATAAAGASNAIDKASGGATSGKEG